MVEEIIDRKLHVQKDKLYVYVDVKSDYREGRYKLKLYIISYNIIIGKVNVKWVNSEKPEEKGDDEIEGLLLEVIKKYIESSAAYFNGFNFGKGSLYN